MIPQQFNQQQLLAMLAWQVEMGADEAVLDTPADEPVGSSPADFISGARPQVATAAMATNAKMAATATTLPMADGLPATASDHPPSQKTLDHLTSLADLAAALEQLEACPLKHTASAMCFADGNAGARLMIIGEVPGRDEDRLGVPFVGAAGQFLDRMICFIRFNQQTHPKAATHPRDWSRRRAKNLRPNFGKRPRVARQMLSVFKRLFLRDGADHQANKAAKGRDHCALPHLRFRIPERFFIPL